MIRQERNLEWQVKEAVLGFKENPSDHLFDVIANDFIDRGRKLNSQSGYHPDHEESNVTVFGKFAVSTDRHEDELTVIQFIQSQFEEPLRTMVLLRYDGATMGEIGDHFGVTQSRISKIFRSEIRPHFHEAWEKAALEPEDAE